MVLYVLFGIPASGKTTLARQLEAEQGCKVHCYDDLYEAAKDRCTRSEINDAWVRGIRSDLLAGFDVVCDGIFTQTHLRTWLLKQLADIPCKKMLIAVVAPVETCVERNSKREGVAKVPQDAIEAAAKHMQPPTDTEGWDEITVYEN